jgi:hypothetical protein
MLIAALFIIAMIWNQPKCSSTNEWNNVIIYIYMYIMEYYSIIKKSEIL